MTCSITYSGNWAPVMRWFNSVTRHNYTDVTTDHYTTSTTDDDSSSTTSETTVTSQLTLTASASLQGSAVVSVTYFTSTSLPTTATNVPSYTYNWMSPTLDVQCKQAIIDVNYNLRFSLQSIAVNVGNVNRALHPLNASFKSLFQDDSAHRSFWTLKENTTRVQLRRKLQIQILKNSTKP